MTRIAALAGTEFLVAGRNFWVATAIAMMMLFAAVLTLAGTAPTGVIDVDKLTVAATSLTTLSVYVVPLIGLLLSFDAIAGEAERGTLALMLTYPTSRASLLFGKFLAHIGILALAIGCGLGVAIALAWSDGIVTGGGIGGIGRLYLSSLLLGACFLGVGYAISSSAGSVGAAAGIAIGIWLLTVVLYDLGLLGALVADNGGAFTQSVFPWLLVANPADAFRLVNTVAGEQNLMMSGMRAGSSIPAWAPVLSVIAWPVAAFALAWTLFRRIEP